MPQSFDSDRGLTPQEQDDLLMHLSKAADIMKKYHTPLNPEERRGNRSVGRRRQAYVQQCLRLAKAHEHILPRNLSVLKFERTLEIFEKHKDIQVKLSEIIEMADDTQLAIGRELMALTDTTYGSFKLAKLRDASMDRIFSELEEFNQRSSQEEDTETN